MNCSSHHYLFDVIPLLDDCIDKLQTTIHEDCRIRHATLQDMKGLLVHVECILHQYLNQMIRKESRTLKRRVPHDSERSGIKEALATFHDILKEKKRREVVNQRKIRFLNPQDPPPVPPKNFPYTTRSATDSLLFRLIVALQLCLLRIDDAHLVITGRRINPDDQRKQQQERKMVLVVGVGCCCLLGTAVSIIALSNKDRRERTIAWKKLLPIDRQSWVKTLSCGGAIILAGRVVNTQWKKLWMIDKLFKSTCEIEEWTRQWETVQHTIAPRNQLSVERFVELDQQKNPTPALLEDKSRRLIEYAMKNSPKSYFWQSQGEIRFLMLKRFMDVYYASVGTAIGSSSGSPSAKWKVPLITGAAASFYSITGTGASVKASHAINHASRDLIQHAW